MAEATYSPTLSTADVNKIWRKVQGKLQTGFRFLNEEWEMLDDIKENDLDVSAREVTVPLDIELGAGIASIPEGGWEAVPSSPNVQELTLNWILLNGRFTASKTAKYLARRNAAAQITDQIKYQGRKKIEALAADFADRFYGFSTAVLAQVSATGGAGTSQTIPLNNAYGVSGINNAAFIARKFVVGDRVAVIRAGALVSIGTITAVTPATPSITATFGTSFTPTLADSIVKANSMENTTLAGTDYNKGLIGLFDMMTSASLHGLTHNEWLPAYSDVTAGRLTGMDLHRARTEISNYGDFAGKGITVLLSQGVERDIIDQYQGRVQYDSPFGMEIDGSIKSKGVTFRSTLRVPPGYAFAWVNGAIRKWTLINKPEMPGWDDAKEMIDRSGFIFTIDFPVQLIVTNRRALSYFANASEI